VQYANGYHDFNDLPNRNVASFTTVDLHLKRRFGGGDRSGNCTFDFSVDVQNVFNRAPPFVNLSVGLGFDTTNAGILGRVVKMGVRKCW
jgi:iron complex outermembrane recepter protein